MQTFQSLAILALAGSAVAAPWNWQSNQYWQWGPDSNSNNNAPSNTQVDVTTTIVWVTATPTAAYNAPSATAAYVPAQQTQSSTPSSGSSSSSTGASGGVSDYMAIVSKWRAAGGLPALTQDSTLEANAQKTVNDDKGTMKHELNPGSMAQVLAPGNLGNFENVYVGGWLCEVPSLPGLDGICNTMDAGWDHSSGETGHADILTSKSYTKIGCAFGDTLWGCDLA